MDVLERWHGRVPMYVCSGTPQEELQSVLEQRGLARYFTGICGTPPAKAELLKGIVRKERIDPADAVMVGDATTDSDAAEAAENLFYGRGLPQARTQPLAGRARRGMNKKNWRGRKESNCRLPPRFRSDRTQPLAGRARGECPKTGGGRGNFLKKALPPFPPPKLPEGLAPPPSCSKTFAFIESLLPAFPVDTGRRSRIGP